MWISTLKGVWPNFLVWSPPWLYVSSVENKTKLFGGRQIKLKIIKYSIKIKNMSNLMLNYITDSRSPKK